jgi:hypothetical protein
MQNDILLKRICQIIGMSYAVSKEEVWKIYLMTNSIDKTLETVSNLTQS